MTEKGNHTRETGDFVSGFFLSPKKKVSARPDLFCGAESALVRALRFFGKEYPRRGFCQLTVVIEGAQKAFRRCEYPGRITETTAFFSLRMQIAGRVT